MLAQARRGAKRTGPQTLGQPSAPVSEHEAIAAAAYEIAVVENLQREDMTDTQTAQAYKWLLENRNYGVREMARRLGKSHSEVSRKLAILRDEILRKAVEDGDIIISQAQELLALEKQDQIPLVKSVARRRAVGQAPSLPALRQEVKDAKSGALRTTSPPAAPADAPAPVAETPISTPLIEETGQLLTAISSLTLRLQAVRDSEDKLPSTLQTALRDQLNALRSEVESILEILNSSSRGENAP